MENETNIKDLKLKANQIRKDVLTMVHNAKSGHIGGALSCADILAVLYFNILNLDLDKEGKRIDKFILSKGHASAAYYSALASYGFFDRKNLNGFRNVDSFLEGHPSIKIPGVDCSSGSLGQGLSIANGMALSKKISKKTGNVYCLLGDGELEEGQVWEALMSSHKFNLNNLVIIIDYNGLQIDGTIKDIKNLNDIDEKIKSFGIKTLKIDGHDIKALIDIFKVANSLNEPVCIIAKTIKGKGVDFMENNVEWHGKAVNDKEYINAMSQLEKEVM